MPIASSSSRPPTCDAPSGSPAPPRLATRTARRFGLRGMLTEHLRSPGAQNHARHMLPARPPTQRSAQHPSPSATPPRPAMTSKRTACGRQRCPRRPVTKPGPNPSACPQLAVPCGGTADRRCGSVSVMAGGDAGTGWDFFISYTQADRRWAEWIAWVLEEHGHYRVLVQVWDFVLGSNWIADMHAGTRDAARTVAVLSNAYLASQYGSAEWQAAWAADPDGAKRKLLTVRVGDCARPGLLAGVTGGDLFGLDEAAARARLLGMVAAAIAGRAKP